MPAPYVRAGKQVLHTVDGILAPFADGVSETIAERIIKALELADKCGAWEPIFPASEPGEVDVYFSPRHIIAAPWVRNQPHIITQQSDEYACTCGRRWDVTDGEDHP